MISYGGLYLESIGRQWYQLYENNPKIQAFAVVKDHEIVWQTENWNLVEDLKGIMKAQETAGSKLTVGGVKYKRISSSKDSYIASADKDGGHLLMAQIDSGVWAIAWAVASAVPELAMVDLTKSAISLRGAI